jgi:hypothetical protein
MHAAPDAVTVCSWRGDRRGEADALDAGGETRDAPAWLDWKQGRATRVRDRRYGRVRHARQAGKADTARRTDSTQEATKQNIGRQEERTRGIEDERGDE